VRSPPALLCVLALACSSPTSSSDYLDEVRFRLNGEPQLLRSNTEFLTLTLTDRTFHLSAADYVREPDLALEISLASYHGPGTYPVGYARLTVGEEIYETAGDRGQGTIAISQASCRTEVTTDPVTGITGPVAICRARGSFTLVAVAGEGATAAVTDGRFSLTSVRGSG